MHNLSEVVALQKALHTHNVPYTLSYIYKQDQRDDIEYWSFDIPQPDKLFNAVIANVYNDYRG